MSSFRILFPPATNRHLVIISARFNFESTDNLSRRSSMSNTENTERKTMYCVHFQMRNKQSRFELQSSTTNGGAELLY